MHYGWGWDGWGWGIGMGVGMIVFWAVVIIAVVALIRYLGRGPGSAPPEDTPLDILKKRYARGEITREQYEQMKEDLKR